MQESDNELPDIWKELENDEAFVAALNRGIADMEAGRVVKGYVCDICEQLIIKDAHGGEHPSAGDHDPAYHVRKAYGG